MYFVDSKRAAISGVCLALCFVRCHAGLFSEWTRRVADAETERGHCKDVALSKTMIRWSSCSRMWHAAVILRAGPLENPTGQESTCKHQPRQFNQSHPRRYA
ncbi:hypothetical protein M441DRAFT_350068 [Trichoderma asperellum CBS 433.97]|uniref:Uncharacterized protein n=1 Tax=Trichoderma asperellum (strain ATCC 204424 / CBS 433.97 / NBRC 101777) TaxID=1042311 RepID=A0A2T3ZI58_TRIA4|nr:hypothetical protein M441DRAFT_350068 [Trichoderma asperellum CBS 433.97]PTB44487.1 hypothetical protein M441DRAFT_350068 [Trichoderma asperellum CBS 433.97]